METFLKSRTAGLVQTELYEYLLAANTTETLQQKVVDEKEYLSSSYGHKAGTNIKAQITVARFTAKEPMEETLIRYMQRICAAHPAFETRLNNYSGFPPGKIYVRVQDHTPFQLLGRSLQAINNYMNSCSCPPIQLVTQPHLTIASDLPELVYFKALMDYSQKNFHDTFNVNELVLLRRSSIYNQAKPVNVFHLGKNA